jgi:riboflavin biosynthesis pyrimidine reductase
MTSIVRLFPQPTETRPLKGTYLSQNLRQSSGADGRAFVYGNFVTSLDGRVAVPRSDRTGLTVPKQTANDRDWRLFQELAAQADIIISSGRYLREWAEGKAQELLRTNQPEFADLRAWRLAAGLAPQPDIAVISGSLDFPIPPELTQAGRKCVVFTTAESNPIRVAQIEAEAGQVIVAGQHNVQGDLLVQHMTELGYRQIYSAAGPKVMHLLLAGRVLNRLYLTLTNRLLGGEPFSSIVEGPLLQPAYDMKLHSLYLDPAGVDGLGQLFAAYDRA